MNHSSRSSPLTPTEPESPVASGKKRKAGASGRSVASLTAEQLAKKRANDREAQRAIRERTKATIEGLELKIQQLESQQPYQELQAVIRQKDAIQAENEEIRRRLASILSIIQPVVGAQGLTDLAAAAHHNLPLGFGQQSSPVFHQSDHHLHGGSRQYGNHSPSLSSQHDTSSYDPQFAATDAETQDGNRVWTTPREALNHQRQNLHRNLELNGSGERLSFNFLLDSLNQKSNQIPSTTHALASPLRTSYPLATTTFAEQSQPVWTMQPKHCPPTCPLDSILLTFLRERQHEATQNSGTGASAIIPPAYPSVSSLLNPPSAHHTSNIDPISQLMTDIISKFPNIAALPEQVAVLFVMFLYMRWQIYPTQENYERLPDWFTPRPSQLFTPHPVWIDHLPWPRMRDKVVHSYHDYPFENWFLPYTSGLSVNWPYEPVDCLLDTGDGGPATINPVFERHLRRLDNWSLGYQFAEAFPSLADTATFRDRGRYQSGGAATATTTNMAGDGLDNIGRTGGLNLGGLDPDMGTSPAATIPKLSAGGIGGSTSQQHPQQQQSAAVPSQHISNRKGL